MHLNAGIDIIIQVLIAQATCAGDDSQLTGGSSIALSRIFFVRYRGLATGS